MKNGLPDTYYRDIAKVKNRRDLKENKDANRPKKKAKIKPRRPKPMSEIDDEAQNRRRLPIPVFAGRPEDLPPPEKAPSEAVEDDQVVFQSAQNDQDENQNPKIGQFDNGFNSIQEQPNQFAIPEESEEHKVDDRNITIGHFDALKDQFYSPGIGNYSVAYSNLDNSYMFRRPVQPVDPVNNHQHRPQRAHRLQKVA